MQKPCAARGCRVLVAIGARFCEPHQIANDAARWQAAEDTRRRPEWRKLYKTARWQKLRLQVLARDGWRCQRPECGALLTDGRSGGRAAVVDHKRPHKGDPVLFHDPGNLWALCKPCHDAAKQREERRARWG